MLLTNSWKKKISIFLRLDGCFFFFPNFVSVECVYSHSGLKEWREFEEKTFLIDSTAFSTQWNYIMSILQSFHWNLPLHVWCEWAQVLHNGVFFGGGGQKSRWVFFLSLLAALHLVNDWTVQVVALLSLIWAVKGVRTNTSCCRMARKRETEKGLTTFEADVGEKSLFHSSPPLHTPECLIWLIEMLNLS